MYIKEDYCFEDLKENCWGGAIDTLNKIEEKEKQEDFMYILENELFCDELPAITQINDTLSFDDEYIFEVLGISTNEEESKQ